MEKMKKFYYYHISLKESSLKWYRWAFRIFNISFKKSSYKEFGFRIFGHTFIWVK